VVTPIFFIDGNYKDFCQNFQYGGGVRLFSRRILGGEMVSVTFLSGIIMLHDGRDS
jgi:hypothetical protein